ncbi:bifunctional metallophosphatase/5'-nucleotidase [Rhabdochromatium marinum]|uniref:bifunctional metallophosphatase/5'-nucleotidase n=1 Tax=Rhabdochromatium marinum TaxID=48729 RepID=UPI001902C369|nr:5'-nucleotidase C-terminal domain-containing protein [Rhabdochromatium marinum]MBK1649174.1 multifunctional 2',3'-cyclic-nucleotide 2'-phosphodiesterase/5'-nucleotidase/3'-nucleotidase [Rhabdochromatium marinum]
MTRPFIIVLAVAMLLAPTLALAGEALPLTLLHFNDFHGQLDPVEDQGGTPTTGQHLGGIARLAGLVDSIRKEDPTRPVVLLFGGDLLQGNVTSTVFLGLPDIQILTEIGVDAAVMGNHELDYGQEVFRQILATAGFPILAANLEVTPIPFPTPATLVLHPPNGPRIGILGLVTEELTTTTYPRNTSGIAMRSAAEIEVVVGHNARRLDASRAVIRRNESNFGDWVGDLARAQTGADVALFNAGTFRAGLPAGAVRLRDLHQAFPFGNELVTATISGARLEQVLNRSAALDPRGDPGGFLQVSGVRLMIADGTAQEIQVGGKPLDRDADYWLVMPDFLTAGGDGYAELKDLPDATETGLLILDLVTDAFRQQGRVDVGIDGRLVRR